MDRPDIDLSTPPEDPEAERRDLDEDIEAVRAEFDAEYGELLNELEVDIQDLIARTETLTFESQGLFRVQRRVMRDPLEAARSSEGHDEIQRREDETQNLLDRNGASDGSGENGEGGNRNASWSAKRWMALLGILTLAGLGVLFEELYRKSTNKSDADVPLSDDVKKKVQEAIQQQGKVDDKTFWGNMATFAQNNSLTLADMVYFMQYAQQFFPLTRPFLWDRMQDKVDISNNLEKGYRDAGSIAAVLGALPTLTYHGAPLPRYMQASCAQLAFAELSQTKAA